MVEKRQTGVPATTYADPFQAFRTEMDRLAESFFGRSLTPFRAGDGEMGMVMPSIDVKEDDKAIILSAELPGMKEDDVNLEVKNGVLTLKGEKKHSYDETKDDVQIMERRYGAVQRTLRLPDSVDPENIEATFDDGVLTVTMPKKPEMAPASRKISIKH